MDRMCAHYDPQTDPARLNHFFGVSDLPLGLKSSLWPGYHGPFVRKHEFAEVGGEAVPLRAGIGQECGCLPAVQHFSASNGSFLIW